MASARAYARAAMGACATLQDSAAMVDDLGALERGERQPESPSAETLAAIESLGGPARRARLASAGWRDRVTPVTLRLLEALASRDELHLLAAVRAHCLTLQRRAEGRVAVVAEFAAAPDPAAVALLRDRLVPAGAPLDVEVHVKPELLGGFTVRVADRLVDASLAGRLSRLRTALAQPPAQPTGTTP
ncbi:MAG: F0F1 ATP synthase subunit delta [Kiritimatiellae bacterium]|nr:F0F1 ATP synthase subunit delta [Kiritimatiellia bacterium]